MLLVGRSRDRIPVASVSENFLVDTDRTMCPGVNSASKKKRVSGIPLGVKAAGAWGWRPTTLVVPNVKKSGALTYPDPLGHLEGLLWERPLPLPLPFLSTNLNNTLISYAAVLVNFSDSHGICCSNDGLLSFYTVHDEDLFRLSAENYWIHIQFYWIWFGSEWNEFRFVFTKGR